MQWLKDLGCCTLVALPSQYLASAITLKGKGELKVHTGLFTTSAQKRWARKYSFMCIGEGEKKMICWWALMMCTIALCYFHVFIVKYWNHKTPGLLAPISGPWRKSAFRFISDSRSQNRERKWKMRPLLHQAWIISGLFMWDDEFPLLLKSV